MPTPLIDFWSPAGECIDGLIWIGSSYRQILCNANPTCAPPFGRGRAPCFVHEAEWRGISRKIARIPSWVVPGRTRIFLAHQGGRSAKHKVGGKIFGYFVVGRPEILDDDIGPGATPGGDPVWVRKRRCWDGSVITTHKYRGGRWVRTGQDCPDLPRAGCRQGEVKTRSCPDGSTIQTAVCRDGRWHPTDAKCPGKPRISCEKKKIPRECVSDADFPGLRTTPDASYLVDALDAAITDEFCSRLREWAAGLGSSANLPATAALKELTLEHQLFVHVAAETKEALEPIVVLPERLIEVAYVRGPLVLFRKQPLYDTYPSAVMLHIKHIDGDHLMEQIEAGLDRVRVCSCVTPGANQMTKKEIVKRLACHQSLSENLVDRFLRALPELAEAGLRRDGVFRLPGLGVFRKPGQRGRAITQAQVESHLAGKLKCPNAIVHRLLGDLETLAQHQLRAGRSFRLTDVGTFKPDKNELRLRLHKKMSDFGVQFTPASTLWRAEP